MNYIDAKGQACPIPVVRTKKELDAGAEQVTTAVDNKTSVENLTRLGESQGYAVSVRNQDDWYEVTFTRTELAATLGQKAASRWALFVGKDRIGSGSDELGGNLMTMFFYTLAQGDDLPASILFMNGGVKLPAQNDQVVEHLQALMARGCEVLVCGTCLNYYGIADQLKVGTVSNMYDILSRMQAADKVIQF